MTRQAFAKFKAEFIAKRQELLLKKISVAEKALYVKILDDFIDKLELVDGKLTSNGKNIQLTTAIDKIFNEFNKTGYVDVIKQFTGDLTSITQKNAEYFRILGEAQDRIPKAAAKANERLYKQLGIDQKGKVKPNGYLDKLIRDKNVLKQIKKSVYKGIAGNVDLKTIQDDLKFVLEGNEKVNGALTRHLNTFVMDTYQNHDRNTGDEFAKSIELNAGFYAGGVIGTSRCFCKERNGKVFTREEIKSWKSLIGTECGPVWSDKLGEYDPIENLGGPGCRHGIDWITNSEAIRRRPELKGILKA